MNTVFVVLRYGTIAGIFSTASVAQERKVLMLQGCSWLGGPLEIEEHRLDPKGEEGTYVRTCSEEE